MAVRVTRGSPEELWWWQLVEHVAVEAYVYSLQDRQSKVAMAPTIPPVYPAAIVQVLSGLDCQSSFSVA